MEYCLNFRMLYKLKLFSKLKRISFYYRLQFAKIITACKIYVKGIKFNPHSTYSESVTGEYNKITPKNNTSCSG